MSLDPVAFRSDRLPTEHFDERFSNDNLAFWVPRLLKAAQITPGLEVLDLGCGTGGFARAIASSAPAWVTGYDRAERFIDFAKQLPRLQAGAVRWVVGDAERLPFGASSFDRVLLSLVLHQLADPRAAVAEAFRVLRAGGLVLVRTIAPGDVADRIPQRFIPRMAASDAARLPPVEAIAAWLVQAGFTRLRMERHLRNARLVLAEIEHDLRIEARARYGFLASEELDESVRRMRPNRWFLVPRMPEFTFCSWTEAVVRLCYGGANTARGSPRGGWDVARERSPASDSRPDHGRPASGWDGGNDPRA